LASKRAEEGVQLAQRKRPRVECKHKRDLCQTIIYISSLRRLLVVLSRRRGISTYAILGVTAYAKDIEGMKGRFPRPVAASFVVHRGKFEKAPEKGGAFADLKKEAERMGNRCMLIT